MATWDKKEEKCGEEKRSAGKRREEIRSGSDWEFLAQEAARK